MNIDEALRDGWRRWGAQYLAGIQRRRAKRLEEDANEYENPEARRLVIEAAKLVRRAGEIEGWEQD